MRLALLALALSTCTVETPAPQKAPDPPPAVTVTAPPVGLPDAGPSCAAACATARATPCKDGLPLKPLEHCLAQCPPTVQRLFGAKPECVARILTCGEDCS